MPAHVWPQDPVAAAGAHLDARNPQAGACLLWAKEAVDGLHYLTDLEDDLPSDALLPNGHHATVVHITHARWAVGTAMTALDLCAAAVGFLYLPARPGGKFYDFGQLLSLRRQDPTMPCQGVSDWVGAVITDPKYAGVEQARQHLTHRMMNRHFKIGLGGPVQTAESTGLSVGTSETSAREMVHEATMLATTWVESFVDRVNKQLI
jgi:hypothetical protein